MKSETSFRVFFLKQHRKNSLKNIFFLSESVFLDFSFWPQGHHSTQNAHCALWGHRLPVTALALSARRSFGPARFARGLDNHSPQEQIIFQVLFSFEIFGLKFQFFLPTFKNSTPKIWQMQKYTNTHIQKHWQNCDWPASTQGSRSQDCRRQLSQNYRSPPAKAIKKCQK